MKYYLYNPLANNGIKPDIADKVELTSVIGLDYQKFFDELNKEDEVVMIGGDGTLNHLINAVDTDKITNNVYWYPAGTGNDFLNDIGGTKGEEILINQYIKNLPTVYVKDIVRKFINGIGYGIDGYCCEEADKIKEKTPNAKINYTSIAIKGLLFKFKPKHCTMIVDGEKFETDHTWIGCAMKGRYYGGGMKVAPEQDRNSGMLTGVTYACKSKLKALTTFPSIFKGEHVLKEKIVKVHPGKVIEVSFDKPCALQIDGDTVLDVLSYKVVAK